MGFWPRCLSASRGHHGLIAAEVFAAMSEDNNDKIKNDFKKLKTNTKATHKYLYYRIPSNESLTLPQLGGARVIGLPRKQDQF